MEKIIYSLGFPRLKQKSCLVIYDQRLVKNAETKKWLSQFSRTMAVKAGEELKSLDAFPAHVEKVMKKIGNEPVQDLTLVAVGGGSVGDFVGFLASVLKRGVRLVHIPSTWLAAIDSAHGGKTALNVGEYKNQIGTFYPADQIYISKKLLATQSSVQLSSAYGELFKIALINGGQLAQKVLKLKKLNTQALWSILPLAINAKMKIVKADPYEKKKIRYYLNLGHSFGHALELEQGLSHGEAVLQGTFFALQWSLRKKLLPQSKYSELTTKALIRPRKPLKLKAKKLEAILSQDKKSAGNSHLHFVFLEKPGKCRLEKVKLSELVLEAKRQGWVSN